MTTIETSNPARVDNRALRTLHSDLVGRTVAITGGGRGMGACFAENLARKGVNVVIGDIEGELVDRVAEQITERVSGQAPEPGVPEPGRVAALRMDVTSPEDHQALVEAAVDRFGGLHGWVNNAGLFPAADFLDVDPVMLDRTLRVNVDGVFFGGQAAARHFRGHGGGAIVNMASVAAVRVRLTRSVYNASKAAVRHLNSAMAVELGPLGIRVNAVAPGFIDTEMTRWVQDQPELLERTVESLPLRRIGSPIEVFGAVYFLLSDSARYVSGSVISVDGGSQHI